MDMDERQQVVLVLGGAFNPIHTEHVNIMKLAKGYLEENTKFRVAEGYLAAATDGYIEQKMRNKSNSLRISGKDRLKMCNIAIENEEWIKPVFKCYGSAWECAVNCRKNDNYKIAIVLGADRAISRNQPKWRRPDRRDLLNVIVGRGGECDHVREMWLNDIKNGVINEADTKYYFVQLTTPDVSSSIIRELFIKYRDNEDLNNDSNLWVDLENKNLMDKNVIKYIQNNKAILFN